MSAIHIMPQRRVGASFTQCPPHQAQRWVVMEVKEQRRATGTKTEGCPTHRIFTISRMLSQHSAKADAEAAAASHRKSTSPLSRLFRLGTRPPERLSLGQLLYRNKQDGAY